MLNIKISDNNAHTKQNKYPLTWHLSNQSISMNNGTISYGYYPILLINENHGVPEREFLLPLDTASNLSSPIACRAPWSFSLSSAHGKEEKMSFGLSDISWWLANQIVLFLQGGRNLWDTSATLWVSLIAYNVTRNATNLKKGKKAFSLH